MRNFCLILATFLFSICQFQLAAQRKSSRPIIIDHTCTNLSDVPANYIQQAREKFKIAYGHTSHGSQIVSGMNALSDASGLFRFNRNGSGGALSFWDRIPSGDLGNPNRTEWANRTKELLQGRGKDRNMIMWSWCGQVGSASKRDVDGYLELMSGLEKEFPNVTFVYMTGHLDGTGKRGNLNQRNEQIRKYCKSKGKILFDFADIESYDPDGRENYMELNGRDTCDYRKGRNRYNWAEEWIKNNPDHGLALPSSAAHTHPLNGALKGRAFWWMMAQLAGWNPPSRHSSKHLAPVKRSVESYKEEDAPAKAPSSSQQDISKIYRFNRIGDYRDWKAFGTDNKSVIPEQGRGLDIPAGGKPALAVYRKPLKTSELEFKARLVRGNHVNWYINSKLDGSWRPKEGIGGIINHKGCMLTLDGKVISVRNSPKIDRQEHHYQVNIKDGKLIWGMDGKVIAERKIPQELIDEKGSLAIGAWNSNVRVNSVYIKGSE